MLTDTTEYKHIIWQSYNMLSFETFSSTCTIYGRQKLVLHMEKACMTIKFCHGSCPQSVNNNKIWIILFLNPNRVHATYTVVLPADKL